MKVWGEFDDDLFLPVTIVGLALFTTRSACPFREFDLDEKHRALPFTNVYDSKVDIYRTTESPHCTDKLAVALRCTLRKLSD